MGSPGLKGGMLNRNGPAGHSTVARAGQPGVGDHPPATNGAPNAARPANPSLDAQAGAATVVPPVSGATIHSSFSSRWWIGRSAEHIAAAGARSGDTVNPDNWGWVECGAGGAGPVVL